MESVSLSMLIDRLESEVELRDRAFVHGLGLWLHERANKLRLDVVERLGLSEVVLTLQMKNSVKLIITGFPPDDMPGEVTLNVHELDFPHVKFYISNEPYPDPYEICTLDYSLAGQKTRVTDGPHRGTEGELVVAATVSGQQQNRVRLSDGEVLTLDGDVLELIS